MKKLLLCLLLIFISKLSSAQYRCIPELDARGNPGATMHSDGNAYGTQIIGTSAIPRWSSIVHIPFPFLFNGSPVTDFKVSTSGVLTFSTSVPWVPPHGNATLPSPAIPDKSVCVWGLQGSYSQSRITWTQETNYNAILPSRQIWISFYIYLDASHTNSSSLWSIVLEENTNNIYIVLQDGSVNSVTVGVQVDQNTTCMAPGSPYIAHAVGNNFYSGNNLYYTFIHDTPPGNDGAIIASANFDYLDITASPFFPGVVVRNLGTDTIHSLTLSYSINGSNFHSENFTGLNLFLGDKKKLSFSQNWSPPDTGEYIFDFHLSGVNNLPDQDTLNNKFIQRKYISPAIPKRKVMMEEFKGTWCTHAGTWTHRYDSVLNANKTKACSIKYEDDRRLAWDAHDEGVRQALYRNYFIPSCLANGSLSANDSMTDAQNTIFPGCPWNITQRIIDSLYELPGLFYVQPQLTVNGFTAHITGTVTSAVRFPSSTHCKMFISIVQDTISFPYYLGASGETLFVNTSKKLIPDNHGIYIGSPVWNQTDSIDFTFNITDTTAIASRLHVVVFIQDSVTKEIYQCGESPPAVQSCQPTTNVSYYDLCFGDSIFIAGAWRTRYEGADYSSLLTGSNGCDSLQIDVVRFHYISATVAAWDGQVQLNSYGTSYNIPYTISWYDSVANQFIPGADSNIFIPTHSGWYGVYMVDSMGCEFTSKAVFTCTPDSVYMSTSNIWGCQGDSVDIGGVKVSVGSSSYGLHLTNIYGCDSIVIYNIHTNYVNYTLTVAGNQLSVPTGSLSYQWYDCTSGLSISGATSNTFIGDTINGGIYYCQVTATSGCVKNSACMYMPGCNGTIYFHQLTYCHDDSVYFGGHWYSSPGFFYDTIPSPSGCDTVFISEINESVFDTLLTVHGDSIIAHSGYSHYDWIDCQNGVVQSVHANIFRPTVSGNYSVILHDSTGCSTQSGCATVITNRSGELTAPLLNIWPNPADRYVTISTDGNQVNSTIEIIDLNGRVLRSTLFQENRNIVLSLDNLPDAIYFIRINSSKGDTYTKRLSVIHADR